MTDQKPPPLITRRGVITASIIATAGAGLVLIGVTGRESAPTATARSVSGIGYRLTATGMTVTLTHPNGSSRLVFDGYRFGAVKPASGRSRVGSAPDGAAAIIVDYDTGVKGTTLRGTFTPRGRRLEIVFDIIAPAGQSFNGATLRRHVVPGSIVETAQGVPRWTRDKRGGVPFEAGTSTVYEEAFAGDHVYLALKGSNPAWRDRWALNLPATETSSGVYRAVADIAVVPKTTMKIAAAIATDAAIGVDLGTDQPFNIWKSAVAPLIVAGSAYNGRDSRELTMSWRVRDFDGTELANRTTTQVVDAGTSWDSEIDFRLPGRDIAFVELTVSGGSDTDFARTNVAVLPPHTFGEGETSTIGLAADFLTGEVAERELIARLGTRWSRHGQFTPAELTKYHIQQNRVRTPESPTMFEGDPGGLAAYINGEIDTAESEHARLYELANEWNLRGHGLLTGKGGAAYVKDWIIPFKKRLAQRHSTVKLMSVALGGMDYEYAQNMFDAGLARHVDAFALHPGRGNFVPDFAPTRDKWTPGSKGSYWNFLGAVREARRMLDARAPHVELWLTEAYACTQPNRWWHDTYRAAGENALLTHVLAMTEGVMATEWFQFYDSRKANPTGANPDNPEYHYGLVMRDHSPKPSLLGIATAAEHLDGAAFLRWIEFGDSDTKGVLFSTPRGQMSVLWSRADGYVLNTHGRDGSFFPATEPWVDTWPTKVRITIPATGDSIRQFDCIGRETSIPVSGGRATLSLDGAPRIYYGLDFSDS